MAYETSSPPPDRSAGPPSLSGSGRDRGRDMPTSPPSKKHGGSATRDLSPWSARRALTLAQAGKQEFPVRRKSRSKSRDGGPGSHRSMDERPVTSQRASPDRSREKEPRDAGDGLREHKTRESRNRSMEKRPKDTKVRSEEREPKDIKRDLSPVSLIERGESTQDRRREASPEPYRKPRDRPREKQRGESRDRKRDRSRDRKKDGSRDRRRDRSSDRHRDRSRDRRRNRSSEGRRDRSKERKRDRSKDRDRHRSRERDRKRSASPLRDRPPHKRRDDRSRSRSPKRRKHSSSRTPSPQPRSRKPLPAQDVSFRGLDDSKQPPTKYGGAPPDREKPNFKPTGLLAREANKVEGTKISLKYHEPPEARKPPPSAKWQMFVFKGAQDLGALELHTQSCWLLGRAHQVADIVLEHESCSQQHAAIQFRYIQKTVEDADGVRQRKGRVKPYIIDLESSNGTELNGEEIEGGRYFELRDKDILRFGGSEREYVVMLPKD